MQIILSDLRPPTGTKRNSKCCTCIFMKNGNVSMNLGKTTQTCMKMSDHLFLFNGQPVKHTKLFLGIMFLLEMSYATLGTRD